MLRRVSIYLRQNVLALVALFVAVGTGGAYAANTIGSADIIDGEVRSVDIANDSIHSGDILDNTINTFDVHSFLGVDVVDGTLTGTDIADFSINSSDIQGSSIEGFHIDAGTLKDEDVGQGVSADFAATIGTVNATSCVNRTVTGLNALRDHLLLTPALDDAHGALMYDARYDIDTQNVTIHVCNFSNAAINDGTTHFNLLVFNAN